LREKDNYLRFLSLVEGAYPNPEDMRLPIVPEICMALTATGHSFDLMVGGLMNKNIRGLLGLREQASEQANLSLKNFHIKSFRAYSKWSFSPAMIRQTATYARRADIIMLHSLYSFPTRRSSDLSILFVDTRRTSSIFAAEKRHSKENV
jgi:hypothetical protein